MATGITALTCRLDADVPVGAGGIDWEDLKAFLGARPAFAGKYLVGSPWRWVHGEATSLVDPVVAGASLRLAPIAASDSVRQAQNGDLGIEWGSEDGWALAHAIQAALTVGDLALPPNSHALYVYLEVAAGTALTPEYWWSWALAITHAVLIGDPSSGGRLPMMQSLLPCIATPFTAGAARGTWELPQTIRDALETVLPRFVFGNARCHGFWASTVNPSTIAPNPTPSWPTFKAYDQPQSSTPVAVPVLLWRYATGDPTAPVHGVGQVTVDFTSVATGHPDAALDGMLTVRPWTAANRPTQIGVDRGASVATQVRCLTTKSLKVDHLPQRTTDGFFEGPELTPKLQEPASFVIRYASAGPRTVAGALRPPSTLGGDKDVSRQEAELLAARGVDVVTSFQTRRATYRNVPADLSVPAHGEDDGFAAGWFAANVIRQPSHTPIYFSIDTDVTTSGVSTREGPHCITPAVLVAYFREVKRGVERYLTEANLKMRVPYAIGVYGCARACETLYRAGLATHFWQAFPPSWGDDALDTRSNGNAFKHANIWQVGMEFAAAVMVSSGLQQCRNVFPWTFRYVTNIDATAVPLPASIDVKVGTSASKTLQFPTTEDLLKQATGALGVKDDGERIGRVRGQDGNWHLLTAQLYRLFFNLNPGTLQFTTQNNDFNLGIATSEQMGVHDLNVAWGDPGGWRPQEPF